MDPFTAIATGVGVISTLYSLISGISNKAQQDEIQGWTLEGQVEELEQQQEAFELAGGTGEYDPTLAGFEKYLEGADEEDLGTYEKTAKSYLEQVDYLTGTWGVQQEKLIDEQLAAIQGSARVSAAAGGIKSSSASVRALQEQSAENAALDIDELWEAIQYGGDVPGGAGTNALTTQAEVAIGEAAIYKGKADVAGGWIDIYDKIYDKYYKPPEPTEPTEPAQSPNPDPDTDADADADAGNPFTGPYDMGP